MQASRHFSVDVDDEKVFYGVVCKFSFHSVFHVVERKFAVVGDYDVEKHIRVRLSADDSKIVQRKSLVEVGKRVLRAKF